MLVIVGKKLVGRVPGTVRGELSGEIDISASFGECGPEEWASIFVGFVGKPNRLLEPIPCWLDWPNIFEPDD